MQIPGLNCRGFSYPHPYPSSPKYDTKLCLKIQN